MWAVSDRFLSALGKAHRRVTEVTFTAPGGQPQVLRLKSGGVQVDAGANYRRTGHLQLFGSASDYDLLTIPGGLVSIRHGIRFGTTSEMVPVFHGEVAAGSQQMGEGTISCRLVDRNKVLERARFISPYAPPTSARRVDVIAHVVEGAVPGATVVNMSTDTAIVGGAAWDSRLDVVNDLTKDAGTEAFWAPDGTFVIRDRMTIASAPVWTVAPGRGGTLTLGIERVRPMDRLYNTVVVRPSASDGSQTWAQQVVQVTDLSHPRHPSKVGVVPYFWNSPTIRSADEALRAGGRLLDRVLGTTETLEFGAVSNPALEGGDPIRVITPTFGVEPAAIFQHFLDAFTLDLVSGAMTAATRSQVADV